MIYFCTGKMSSDHVKLTFGMKAIPKVSQISTKTIEMRDNFTPINDDKPCPCQVKLQSESFSI